MPPRLSRRRGIAALTTVLVLAGCSPRDESPASGLGAPSSRSVSADGVAFDCGTGDCPTPSAPAGLFPGRLLAYATHGFSRTELASVQSRVHGAVTAVWATEETVRSDKPAYPLTPVATLLTSPTSYAAAAGRPELAQQLAGGVVLAATESQLRGIRTGQTVTMSDGTPLTVTAVVPDQVIGGYEMATSDTVVKPRSTQPASYLLVSGQSSVAALQRTFRTALPSRSVRVESHTANGFLSVYDDVLTQLEIKQRFGEFSMKSSSGGSLVPDSSWTAHWIGTADIKQLGPVKCNKAILPDLSAAMDEITAKGLGKLVNTKDFQYEGGCWNPRTTRFSDGGALSAHAWGIAVDINVAANPLGATPHQDPRLVAIMAAHGFTWGGNWLRPDGAHFEWVGTAMSAPGSTGSAG